MIYPLIYSFKGAYINLEVVFRKNGTTEQVWSCPSLSIYTKLVVSIVRKTCWPYSDLYIKKLKYIWLMSRSSIVGLREQNTIQNFKVLPNIWAAYLSLNLKKLNSTLIEIMHSRINSNCYFYLRVYVHCEL